MSEQLTMAQRKLGEQLSAFRKASKYSQERLAMSVGYSRSSITNIETGRQQADERFWSKCDEELSANGQLLTVFHQLEVLRRQAHLQLFDVPSPERESPLVGTLDDAGGYSPAHLLAGAQEVKLSGRSLVNIFNQYTSQMMKIAQSGGQVRIILMEPVRELGQYLYTITTTGDDMYATHCRTIAGRIRYMKSVLGDDNTCLQIRMIPLVPSYSMLLTRAANLEDPKLIVQVNFLFTRTERDRPLLHFGKNDPWLKSFESEFDEVWARSKPWEEPHWLNDRNQSSG